MQEDGKHLEFEIASFVYPSFSSKGCVLMYDRWLYGSYDTNNKEVYLYTFLPKHMNSI